MKEDISNKAVLILVVIAVVVSMLSTVFVLNTIYTISPTQASQSGVGGEMPSGRVSLTVPPPPATGKVSLIVTDPSENVQVEE